MPGELNTPAGYGLGQEARAAETYSDAIERAKLYPASFEEYMKLPTTPKLKMAVAMIGAEVPRCRSINERMPAEPFTFDISCLSDHKPIRLNAQLAYSGGQWTINGIMIAKTPSIKINIQDPELNSAVIPFADLEIHQQYDDDRYGNRIPTSKEFVVTEPYSGDNPIENQTDPFFAHTVSLIDTGIAALYAQVLDPRIAQDRLVSTVE
jgi:hypothetical protein